MIAGIDLAGVESRPTGLCILNTRARFSTVFLDSEIFAMVNESDMTLAAIDAPLSFRGEPFRDGDRELRTHFPVLPLTFRGMQSLIQRGITVKNYLTCPVIEVYPHAAKKILGITRPEDVLSYGLDEVPSNPHELDAAAAALTGKFYLKGQYTAYGEQDTIIVPQF
jgi:predicted nuclease with RNAse H fold